MTSLISIEDTSPNSRVNKSTHTYYKPELEMAADRYLTLLACGNESTLKTFVADWQKMATQMMEVMSNFPYFNAFSYSIFHAVQHGDALHAWEKAGNSNA